MSAEQALKLFVRHYPEFEAAWESPDNYHRAGEAPTPHGVCAEFASFFVANALSLGSKRAAALLQEVEPLVATDPQDKDPLANALCTCFLENIAQTNAGRTVAQFMGPASRKYFDLWNADA